MHCNRCVRQIRKPQYSRWTASARLISCPAQRCSVVCAGCSTDLRHCHSSACSLDKHQCSFGRTLKAWCTTFTKAKVVKQSDALMPLLFSLEASGIAGSPGAVAKRKGVRIFGRCARHHHASTGWRHLPLVRTRSVDPCQHPGSMGGRRECGTVGRPAACDELERISRAVNGGNVWRDFRPFRGSMFWGLRRATQTSWMHIWRGPLANTRRSFP